MTTRQPDNSATDALRLRRASSVHVLVSGRVQGVCFRMCACDEAERLGVTGWVRNLDDGRVEAVAEGEEADVAAFVDWCRHGPPHARVTDLQVEYPEPTGAFVEFRSAN